MSRRGTAEIHFLQRLHRAREATLRRQAPTSFSDCQVRYHKATPHVNHESLGWNRSPVRRSQHRGRRRRTLCSLVLLDALLISGSLHGVHRLVLATYKIAIYRSAGTQGIARGYCAGFLLVTQRTRNSVMHALFGNKEEEHNAKNIEDLFEQRIKLSRSALPGPGGMRTSGYTADFTPPRLQPTSRAQRTGDRVEILTATGQKIYRSRRRTKPCPSSRIR